MRLTMYVALAFVGEGGSPSWEREEVLLRSLQKGKPFHQERLESASSFPTYISLWHIY